MSTQATNASSQTRPTMPSGTVTFLFTDVEGSTVRWDRDRPAMASAMRRHDAAMRAAIATSGGVVFKTIGDAFCAVFARPESALEAALDAQRALAADDFRAVDGLRVRMALHTGTADERDDDYFGPAVNRVARLLATAWGEQIVLSHVTATLARDALPAGATLRDLGEHRLKDLAQAERVFQLTAPPLRAVFPPLRSLGGVPGNLPEPVTSFVGRDVEARELAALMERARLVTIVGPGGIGKTRLALDAARAARERFPDGAWFVELAPVAEGARVVAAFAEALGVSLPPDADPLAALTDAVRSKRMLLVVDNCEHVLGATARACAALLRASPDLLVVATSRERLRLDGEHLFAIPSLSLPNASEAAALDVDGATAYGAIALFVERARSIDRHFALTDRVVRTIAEIVRRLDGIALAIELAVPRLKMLGLERLRDRLDECFRLLTGGTRDALPHHRTLRATLDWSHDLLDEAERTVFRRASVFVDGFTADALAAVAAGGALDEFAAFDVLESLAEKSLVVLRETTSSGVPRYALLETTRAYARERLADARESDRAGEAHAAFFAGAMRRADRVAEETGRFDALLGIRADLDNLRSAFDWSLARDPAVAVGIVTAGNGALWDRAGVSAEWIERVRDLAERLPAADARSRARVLLVAPALYNNSGRAERAFEAAALALAESRRTGDAALEFRALVVFANAASLARRVDEARAALDGAAAFDVPSLGNVRALPYHGARMLFAMLTGDLATAAASSAEEIRLARAIGDAHAVLLATINLAEVEHARGDTARAIELAEEVVAQSEDVLGWETRSIAHSNLASYYVLTGRDGDAIGAVRRSTELLTEIAVPTPSLAWPLGHAALAHAQSGRLAVAATLGGFCDAVLALHGYEREAADERVHERLLAALEPLEPTRRAACDVRGRTLTVREAIALAVTVNEATASRPDSSSA